MEKRSFYGKPLDSSSKVNGLKWKARLQRKEKEYQKCPVPTDYHPSLTGPEGQWKIFHTQKDAFQYATQRSRDLHVFSCESQSFFERSGQRMFLVTSYPQLWHIYRQLAPHQKHHYEVIPEGSVCRLYFDLEFSREVNPERDGEAMVDIFIKYVCCRLRRVYGLTCGRPDVLQLDSSTDAKFSQHLIFHLPDAAFQDNVHAGHFVHQVCDALLHPVACEATCPPSPGSDGKRQKLEETMDERRSSLQQGDPEPADLQALLVKDKNGDDTTLCDTGVYTKYRNFRLLHSCKLGKNNPLVLGKRNQFTSTPGEETRSPDEQLFLDSLITNVRYQPDLRILRHDAPQKGPGKRLSSGGAPSHAADDVLDGTVQSPYPEVDEFIRASVAKGGIQGAIRRWSYFSQGELIVYDIVKNRWCENIGRPHNSNNVILIADLKAGVYYQKCYDPDCRAANYKSPERPLPEHVLPAAVLSDGDKDAFPEDATNDVTDAFPGDAACAVTDDVTDDDLCEAMETAERSLTESRDSEGEVDDEALLLAAESAELSLTMDT